MAPHWKIQWNVIGKYPLENIMTYSLENIMETSFPVECHAEKLALITKIGFGS